MKPHTSTPAPYQLIIKKMKTVTLYGHTKCIVVTQWQDITFVLYNN